MKSILCAAIAMTALLCGSVFAAPDEAEGGGKELAAAPDDFEKKVGGYLRAKFKGEAGPWYTDSVILLPGHEYLKEEYGISKGEGRMKAATVAREKLLEVDRSDALAVPPEKIDALLGVMEVTVVRIEDDEGYVIEGSDGEGGMRMPSVTNDVVVVARFKGKSDFLAFLFRQVDGKWKVAAEYLD